MSKGYRINCYKCINFYITWQPKHPNGCKAMGFRSRLLPSVVVRQTSGKPCSLYKEKSPKKPNQS